MRFDLEIQPSPINLLFIEQGGEIPNSAAPILYSNINEINVTPSDLVEIELSSKIGSYLEAPVIEQTGSSFTVSSDRILMTNVISFSKITGSRYPIFYKHTIHHQPGKTILDQSIKVFNELNTQLDKDLFVVTSSGDYTYVYINPIDDSILSIEYGDDDKLIREMVKLEPVFKDVSDKLTTIPGFTVGLYEYAITVINGNFVLETGYSGTKFISFDKDFSFVDKPVGQLNGSWYLRFNSLSFKSTGASGQEIKYYPVEFDMHKMQYPDPYVIYTEQLAKILDKKYIKLQSPPDIDFLGQVDIFIRSRKDNTLAYAFTTNQQQINKNTALTGIVWNAISDWNYNGVFKLPTEIDVNEYTALATYTVKNNFFEYQLLDLSAIDAYHSRMIGLYIIEYINNDTVQNSIFYTFIGVDDTRTNSQKYKTNGAGFNTYADYENFLLSYGCANICYVSVSIDKLYKLLETIDCRSTESYLTNQYELAKQDTDIFKKDIIDKEIHLHINDTVYTHIDSSILSGTAKENTEYISFIKDIINKNINISANVVIGEKNV